MSHIKLSWLVPEWDILSLLYYFLVVYPVGYIVVYRLMLCPAWDILAAIWRIGEWSASLYDKLGVTPASILHKEEIVDGGAGGYLWKFFVKAAKFVKDFDDQY
jgi:hypothetical protein